MKTKQLAALACTGVMAFGTVAACSSDDDAPDVSTDVTVTVPDGSTPVSDAVTTTSGG